MTISYEAVEAALTAMFEKKIGGITEFRRHGWTPTIRTILEAAGPHMLRTVTTEDELDALPAGSVVLSDQYRYMLHGGSDCGWPVSFQRWSDGHWHRGARTRSTHPDNFLPATVLHDASVNPYRSRSA